MLAAPLLLAMASALLSASPTSVEWPTERVDLIEANSYYDLNGTLLLEQAIFYEWDYAAGRHQVVAWRLIKAPQNRPRPCDEGYEMIWTESGSPRRVVAPTYRQTWTQSDPEITERKHLASELRRGIFNEKRSARPGSDPLPLAPPPLSQ